MDDDSNDMAELPNFLVFSDDWGRHPSSCQHLVRCMLQQFDVTWVNTIGMRSPRLDWVTVNRVREKIFHWTNGSSKETSTAYGDGGNSPRVLNPKMWPWFKNSFDRRINQFLLTKQLKNTVNRNTIAITTIPITADLMDSLPVQKWVYYCVDDFSVWPGLDHSAMKQMEAEVISKADCLISASQTLQERLKKSGRESLLMTHGVDLEHWEQNDPSSSIAILKDIERPLYLFWGVIDQRLDIQFLKHLNDSIKSGTIVLLGPQQNPGEELSQFAKVRVLSPVSFTQLPAIGKEADVLIMPYVDQPVTRAMQPLKLLEYLATGKPVVVRGLPSTKPWESMMLTANNPDQFTQQVEIAFAEGVTDSQKAARKQLCKESWESKFQQFMQHIYTTDQAKESAGSITFH